MIGTAGDGQSDMGRHQNDLELQFVNKQVNVQAGLDLAIVTAGQGRAATSKSLHSWHVFVAIGS